MTMGFKALLFGALVMFGSPGFSGNVHFHSSMILHEGLIGLVGNCEIEIINRSNVDVQVFGIFDDGSTLRTFNIEAADDKPHYISLFYSDYCHEGMEIYASSLDGYQMYSGFLNRKQPLILVRAEDPGKPLN